VCVCVCWKWNTTLQICQASRNCKTLLSKNGTKRAIWAPSGQRFPDFLVSRTFPVAGIEATVVPLGFARWDTGPLDCSRELRTPDQPARLVFCSANSALSSLYCSPTSRPILPSQNSPASFCGFSSLSSLSLIHPLFITSLSHSVLPSFLLNIYFSEGDPCGSVERN